MPNQSKIKALKEYFQKRDNVLMAFLFGSFAKGLETKDSDVDVAVYLKDQKSEKDIWIQLPNNFGKEIDLVCLNEAPASLISNVFKTGIPLVVKDKKLYWHLYLEKSLEAEDFLHFSTDFLRIYQKAQSLIPEEKIRLLERKQFLDTELKELENFKKVTFREYHDNKMQRRNIERWTENIINASIDIAKIVLASEKKRMPKTYDDALLDFGFLTGLSQSASEKFARFASLRNILAHEYLDILYSRIQAFIKEAPAIYKRIFGFLDRY